MRTALLADGRFNAMCMKAPLLCGVSERVDSPATAVDLSPTSAL